MSSLTAALGISQLSKLDKLIKMRQENARYISSQLSKFSQIKLPTPTSGYEHIYQMYTIRLLDARMRDALHQFLLGKRIFSKVYFNPIHLTKFYRDKFGTMSNSLPITEKIAQEVLTIPLYPNMNSEEKTYLTESISEFFESRN
jgi:perosamine synthetase